MYSLYLLFGPRRERFGFGSRARKHVHHGYGEPAGCPWARLSHAWRGWPTSCLLASLASYRDMTAELWKRRSALGDRADETPEGLFANRELGALLITTDLTGSYGTDSGCAVTCGFGSQLLPRCLFTGGLTGVLLCTCYFLSIRRSLISEENKFEWPAEATHLLSDWFTALLLLIRFLCQARVHKCQICTYIPNVFAFDLYLNT